MGIPKLKLGKSRFRSIPGREMLNVGRAGRAGIAGSGKPKLSEGRSNEQRLIQFLMRL